MIRRIDFAGEGARATLGSTHNFRGESVLMLMIKKILYGAVLVIVAGGMTGVQYSRAQVVTGVVSSAAPSDFPPLEQWKDAVIAGDAAALTAFYSADPAAQVEASGATSGADADVRFWLGLKARSMKLEMVRLKQGPAAASIIFKAEVQTGLPNGAVMNVTDAQGWRKQGEQWRIVGAERTDSPHLPQPSDMKKNLYPDDADAHAEIKEAEAKAAAEHKRVLLVFGANWCYDCHVLDLAFHRPDFASVMAGYEVVHVDLGTGRQEEQ